MRSATVLAIAQCLIIASCQTGLGGSSSQPAPGRQPFIAEFKRIDTAGKGKVTMDEAMEYYRNRFRELDRNGDRFLDVSELEAAMPIMDATSAKELVQKLDRNSDGKLTVEEFSVIANWLFQLAKSPTQLTLSDVEKG
jgi:EF hand domain-containing protein